MHNALNVVPCHQETGLLSIDYFLAVMNGDKKVTLEEEVVGGVSLVRAVEQKVGVGGRPVMLGWR